MAKPLEPYSARSLATEAPPDPKGSPSGKGAVRPSDPPAGGLPPAKPAFKPWPTTETPFSPTDGAGSGFVLPTEDWVEPAAPSMLPYGNYSNGGYAEAADGLLDGYPPMDEWDEAARRQAQEAGIDLADSSPLFPGRRPLYKRSEPPPSANEQLASVIEFLQKLQANIRRVVPETEESSPAALGSTLLQLRRLTRTGVVPDPFEIGVLPKAPKVEVTPPVVEDPVPAGTETVVPAGDLPPPEPVRSQRHHAAWLVLTGGLCLVTLGLVAYLWTREGTLLPVHAAPRNPAPRATTGPAPDQEISEEALNLANAALEEMQRGDLKKAADILAGARKRGIALPGIDYQAALLALNQGQTKEADDFIERSIRANEAVPECWYLRANTFFYSEGPAAAAEAFEQAVAAMPFSPRYYFFRAECLRRNGNAVAAVAQFQQALRCRPSSGDTELILFKIGLTKLETNTDLIFKAELHDRLAQEPVAGDTLLLAAADAIGHNEFSEAAGFLKRAAVLLPPRVFQSRIRDYVFQAQAKQPDIAAVLKLTLTAAPSNGQPAQRPARMLIDPATRSMSEADPGGW